MTSSSRHPLDPVTVDEMTAAIAAIRADGRLGELVRFWGVTLDEAFARGVIAGTEPLGVRKVQVVAVDSGNRKGWEVDVWIGCETEVPRWKEIDYRTPGTSSEEVRAAAQACRESPKFQEVMARRGITDMTCARPCPQRRRSLRAWQLVSRP